MPSEAYQQLLVRLQEIQAATPQTDGELDYAALRAGMEARAYPTSEGTEVGVVDAGGVPAEWVWWPGADMARRILHLHGGGFVMGSPATHRELAGRLSRASGCVVLLLDYRLAPEAPYPAALDDTLTALDWMMNNGPDGPAPAAATGVSGDSAGGGLAISALLARRDYGMPLPDAGLTMSAWADLLCSGESYQRFGGTGRMGHMTEAYLNGVDPKDPLASPVYGDFSGLPPLLIQVGDAEAFLDDSTTLAERAKAAGVDVTLEVWPEMIHVFQQHAPAIPEGQEGIDHAGAFLRQRLGVEVPAAV
jgi:acetyl esterase/lipase